MSGGFFPIGCGVKSPRAWRCRKRARPCLKRSRGGGLIVYYTKHKQILKARNTETSKLQPKNWQDRVCRIELADWGFKFPPVKSILPPAWVCDISLTDRLNVANSISHLNNNDSCMCISCYWPWNSNVTNSTQWDLMSCTQHNDIQSHALKESIINVMCPMIHSNVANSVSRLNAANSASQLNVTNSMQHNMHVSQLNQSCLALLNKSFLKRAFDNVKSSNFHVTNSVNHLNVSWGGFV